MKYCCYVSVACFELGGRLCHTYQCRTSWKCHWDRKQGNCAMQI